MKRETEEERKVFYISVDLIFPCFLNKMSGLFLFIYLFFALAGL